MSFANKVVLITGGNTGIGAATAIAFVKEGADVAVVGRNEEKLNSVVEKCTNAGKKPLSIKADLAQEKEVERVVKETVEKYGKIDVLVNSAAFVNVGTFLECSNVLELYDVTMNTNLRSHIQMTKLIAPFLIKSKGNIISISSVSAIRRTTYTPHVLYGMSKAALDYFSRGLALDLAPHGVRVNVVNPGPTDTGVLENAGYDYDIPYFKHRLPLSRVSQPEEVADLILFLASDKAKSITGSNYVIDNGFLLKF